MLLVENILYIFDHKLGGVTSLNVNLMSHAPEGLFQEVILIDVLDEKATRSKIFIPADKQQVFRFDGRNNFHHNLRKLRESVRDFKGPMIVNYGIEMAMLDHYPVQQTVFQLVHDDYNLRLAIQYHHVVDVFICHNKNIRQRLLDCLPSRSQDIFYLPHGVDLPIQFRNRKDVKTDLKLLFIGRFTGGKGIFDLPVIASLLRKKGVNVRWTCIGGGPEEVAFKNAWSHEDAVEFCSPDSTNEVLRICSEHDVFVLPTKFEGSPVSLLEAMSVGLVPVVTDLAGGIRETVGEYIGFRVALDDNEAFADAIVCLHEDRSRLNEMSVACRAKVAADFDIKQTSAAYFSLFARYEEFFREKKRKRINQGSRLDSAFIPNMLTRVIRSVLRR
jgi:glycosyltransferase involved in cell wall biosynthesis